MLLRADSLARSSAWALMASAAPGSGRTRNSAMRAFIRHYHNYTGLTVDQGYDLVSFALLAR
jgi:hypothetical protein